MRARKCTLICYWESGECTEDINCNSISEAKKIASTARTEGGCVRYEIWDDERKCKVTQGICK